jgi:beta-glucanase (GH16 family)
MYQMKSALHSLWIVSLLMSGQILSASVSAESAPLPYQRSGEWLLVFQDEFDGSFLDSSKWQPNWLGSDGKAITKPVNVEEVSCYDPAQVSVREGELQLKAEVRQCGRWSYASGLVETDRRFNFNSGYIEAKIQMPNGVGLWPAFWTTGQENPVNGEIDIVEASGTDFGRYHYHYECGKIRCSPGGETAVLGATNEWHIYAVERGADVISWYYDGRKVYEQREGLVSSPHYIVLNLGLRRNSNSFSLPAIMRVDYVRVWRQRME